MSANIIQDLLKPLAERRNLPEAQAARAFQIIMNGGATPAQMGAFLMGLRAKGETPEEISAGAEVMRMKAPRVQAPEGVMDVCGTGGDGKDSLNVSTAVALVVATCGVPVAKHGNRAVSSSSGSADVLAALGVKMDASVPVLERCLREAGICFMMAPLFHTAMRHVAPVRQELGMRTIFNLLGPLSNPAHPKRQLLGVYAREWVEPMARVLLSLGCEAAWVVHGSDGMDELTLSGPTYVSAIEHGSIRSFMVQPEEAGLPITGSDAIRGGNADTNAQALRELLLGLQSPYRDWVLLNAAAALMIAEKTPSLEEGVRLAARAIDEGAAYKTLQKLIELSHLPHA